MQLLSAPMARFFSVLFWVSHSLVILGPGSHTACRVGGCRPRNPGHRSCRNATHIAFTGSPRSRCSLAMTKRVWGGTPWDDKESAGGVPQDDKEKTANVAVEFSKTAPVMPFLQLV